METWKSYNLVSEHQVDISVEGDLSDRDVDNINYLFACNNVDDQIKDIMYKVNNEL